MSISSARIWAARSSSEQVRHVVPDVGERSDLRGHMVGGRDARVAGDGHLGTIVGAQDRQDRVGRRVVAEVGRDVADAERSVRIGHVRMGGSLTVCPSTEARVPAAPLLVGFGLGALLQVEHDDQEAVRRRAVWVEREAGAERRRRLVEPPESLVGDAEMLVGVRVVGLKVERPLVALDRLARSRRAPGARRPARLARPDRPVAGSVPARTLPGHPRAAPGPCAHARG